MPGQALVSTSSSNRAQSLWKEAAEGLQGPFKIDVDDDDRLDVLSLVLAEATNKQEESNADRRRWRIKRSNGKEIVLYEVYSQIVTIVQKFKGAGDVAVNADPLHAGLPWAVVRLLLQVSSARSSNASSEISCLM
jgi:hypothetical protein